MKTRSLKAQIAVTFIILLATSMFMLSCVWVIFTQKRLIEKEIVLLENYADFLAKDLQVGHVGCYRTQLGKIILIEASESDSCPSLEKIRGYVEEGGQRGKNISYSGTQWAVLTFGNKKLIVTKPTIGKDGDLSSSIIIETALEPIYEKIRDDWKIVLFYLLINVIIFSSIGFFRMFKLVLKPINRLVGISRKYHSGTDLSCYSTNSNNEFSQLSLGLNRW